MISFAPRTLSAIAAVAENRVLGYENRLPWHLPDDFKFFKQTTIGHILVMGRKTFESIGRPLPGRTTVVLSRHGMPDAPAGVRVVSSWDEIPEIEPGKKIFVAGGAAIYEEAISFCDELILTHVHLSPRGDAFFPFYETLFDEGEILAEHPQFTIRLHRRR
jgi:dihydrofolate reductase